MQLGFRYMRPAWFLLDTFFALNVLRLQRLVQTTPYVYCQGTQGFNPYLNITLKAPSTATLALQPIQSGFASCSRHFLPYPDGVSTTCRSFR